MQRAAAEEQRQIIAELQETLRTLEREQATSSRDRQDIERLSEQMGQLKQADESQLQMLSDLQVTLAAAFETALRRLGKDSRLRSSK
jgi:hypothetical protein